MDQIVDVIIVDDDALCISCLSDSLRAYPEISIVGVAQTAQAGKCLIQKNKPALVFLDVELPDMSGLDLLRDLNASVNWNMQVVFYTAHDKYLLDALRESAFDYLLKPFEQNSLGVVMERFYGLQRKGKPVSFGDELNRLIAKDSVFMVATIDGFRLLHLNHVGFFKYLGDKKRWVAVLSDLSEVHLRRTTNAGDIVKYSDKFMQINRDTIINVMYLSMVKGKDCILYPPFNSFKELSASGSFIGQLQERFSLM